MILIKPSLFLREVRAIPSSDIDTPNFLRKRRRTLPFQLMPQPEPPIYVNSNRLRGKCIFLIKSFEACIGTHLEYTTIYLKILD